MFTIGMSSWISPNLTHPSTITNCAADFLCFRKGVLVVEARLARTTSTEDPRLFGMVRPQLADDDELLDLGVVRKHSDEPNAERGLSK